MVEKQLIDKVESIRTTLNEISVYNLDVKTSLELYYELARKVNEVITELTRFEGVVSEEVVKQNEKLLYLLGEGLKEQVGIKIDELITNGTIQDLINNKIFSDLNTKIETFKQQTDEQFNTIQNKTSDNIIVCKKSNEVDNTTDIQSCIDYIFSLGGGTVVLDESNYKFTTLELKEKVNLKSYNKSTLTKINKNDNAILVNGNNVDIENIIFDFSNNAIVGINILSSFSNILIKNNTIKNCIDNEASCVVAGIKINDDSQNINILNNDIFNCVNNADGVARGVFMYTRDGHSTSKNINISYNIIHDINPIQDADGIHLSGLQNQTNKNNITVSYNTFYNCSKRAIKVMCSHVHIHNNVIISNYTNFTTEGMYSGISVYGRLVTIENNQIYNKSFKYGAIDVVGTDWSVTDLIIKNNIIRVGQDGGSIYQGAIQFENNILDNVIIEGNTIESSNFGIVFKRYSKNVKIFNNTITSVNACIKTFTSGDFIKCEDFIISNNTLTGTENYGIQLEKANANFVISNNYISSNFDQIETNSLTEPIIKIGNTGAKEINGIFAYRVTSLPTASKLLEGQILLKYESGNTAWSLHICTKANGVYTWKQLSYAS